MTNSATVRVAGHEFTANYDWIEADDAVGHIAFADVTEVFIGDNPDDVRGILKPVIIDAISRACGAAHRDEARYIGYREDMERLEA